MTGIRDLSVEEQRAVVVRTARTWIGTPYHHAARVKGAGVDCATLLAEVYAEVGLIDSPDIPAYSPQWHLHRKIEKYREFVLRYARAIPESEAAPGDVVLYHWGHVKAHGGIITERGWPHIIHAYSRAKFVIEGVGNQGDLADREREFFTYW